MESLAQNLKPEDDYNEGIINLIAKEVRINLCHIKLIFELVAIYFQHSLLLAK